MSRLTTVFLVVQLLITGVAAMAAQEPSYDENALRVLTRQGSMQILRGVEGTVASRSGMFHAPKVADLVAQSDSALAEARIFERDYQPGQWLLGAAIVSLGAAIGASRINDINPFIPAVLTATTFISFAFGAKKLDSAYQALSKAIWWYNRDLKR
jgi:hypothetical protein